LLRDRVTAIAFLLAFAFAFPSTSPVASQSTEALAFAVMGIQTTGKRLNY